MKKKKENTCKSLWLGEELGEESPIGSIISQSDPLKEKNSLNVKELRRQFATRGKVIKSEKNEKVIVG